MTCYESIVLFMNKWIGILARCANKLLHHDDNVPKCGAYIFVVEFFYSQKGGKTMNNNMVHITIDGKSIQRSLVQRYWVLLMRTGLNIRKFVTCQK